MARAAPPPQDAASQPLMLANRQLRVRVRPDNLTITVDDLATQQTWGSDPWENSAGRVQLRGKHGETVSLSLSAATQKKVEALPGGSAQDGVQIVLAEFRSRMGPVRQDRDPGAHLSLGLQILLARDRPDLTLRVQQLKNESPYWDVETVEWPLRLFPVRTVEDDGYVVFAEQEAC